MIFFRFLPAPDPITPYGMALLGIFIGAVWGWCTVSMIWPSLVALTLLGITGDNTVNAIWTSAWGNPNVIFIFFMLVFAALLAYTDLDKKIAAWIVSRKFAEGRPYVLFGLIFGGCAVTGLVTGPAAAIIIFWQIIDRIVEEVGYKRGEKLPAALTVGVCFCTCLGMLAMPFQTTAVLNFSLFMAGTGGAITSYNYISYLAFGVVMCILSIVVWMLFLRFAIRPDVSLFKNYKATEDVDLHLDKRQKMSIAIFLLLVVFLLVPSLFANSTNPVLVFINKFGTTGGAAIMLGVLAFVVCDGKPLTSIPTLIKNGVIWELIFMLSAGLTIGGQLATPVTGITPFMNTLLGPVLNSVGGVGYLILFMVITLVLTNCANNVPVAAVLLPMQYPICMALGMNPYAMVCIFIFVVDFAIFLPSASPVAAQLHNSDGRVTRNEIWKWAGPLLLLEGALQIVVGYPFASMLFPM